MYKIGIALFFATVTQIMIAELWTKTLQVFFVVHNVSENLIGLPNNLWFLFKIEFTISVLLILVDLVKRVLYPLYKRYPLYERIKNQQKK